MDQLKNQQALWEQAESLILAFLPGIFGEEVSCSEEKS